MTADPRAGQITVRHLLDQTSGLTDDSVAQFSRLQPEALRDSVADFGDAQLATDPGTRWAYYNPNYQIAARLVEVVSGTPFDTYLAGRVFAPLSMTDSRAGATERDLPPSAGGHVAVLGQPVALPEPPAFGAGSGGVLSSARDLAAWLIMQGGGGSLVSPASLDAMHRPSSPASGRYGLGWVAGRTPSGDPLISHGGDLFTSTAYQALLPDTGYGIAVLANTAAGDATALGERLVALVDGAPLPPGPDRTTVIVDAVLIGLGVVAMAVGTVATVGARRWAAAHPRGLLVRLPLHAAPVLLLVLFAPVVQALYRGRDLTWLQAAYQFPSFMIFLGALSVATVVAGCARLFWTARAQLADR